MAVGCGRSPSARAPLAFGVGQHVGSPVGRFEFRRSPMFGPYHREHPLACDSPSMTLAPDFNRLDDITEPLKGTTRRVRSSPRNHVLPVRMIYPQRPSAFGVNPHRRRRSHPSRAAISQAKRTDPVPAAWPGRGFAVRAYCHPSRRWSLTARPRQSEGPGVRDALVQGLVMIAHRTCDPATGRVVRGPTPVVMPRTGP